MAYFQKISAERFNVSGSFVVKESRGLNIVIGLVCSVMAVVAGGTSAWLAAVFGVVALLAFAAAYRHPTVMVINQQGFFYYGRLITTWGNFVSAKFVDEMPTVSANSAGVSDQFYLRLRYYKNQQSGCFERTIRLTNTQDKAEEEIMAAIKFYFDKSREAV